MIQNIILLIYVSHLLQILIFLLYLDFILVVYLIQIYYWAKSHFLNLYHHKNKNYIIFYNGALCSILNELINLFF